METIDTLLAQMPARLRTARQDAGHSLETLAQLSGVSRSMVSQIERGISSPTMATLWHLCDALGIHPATMFDPPDGPKLRVFRGDGSLARGETDISPLPGSALHTSVVHLKSGEVHEIPNRGHSSHFWLTVLDGTLVLQHANDKDALKPGDRAQCSGGATTQLAAKGKRVLVLLMTKTA